jgi:hypothetical protein
MRPKKINTGPVRQLSVQFVAHCECAGKGRRGGRSCKRVEKGVGEKDWRVPMTNFAKQKLVMEGHFKRLKPSPESEEISLKKQESLRVLNLFTTGHYDSFSHKKDGSWEARVDSSILGWDGSRVYSRSVTFVKIGRLWGGADIKKEKRGEHYEKIQQTVCRIWTTFRVWERKSVLMILGKWKDSDMYRLGKDVILLICKMVLLDGGLL